MSEKDKDFLSQFSSDGKTPDSFKEEELIKVEKPKKPFPVKGAIIGGVVLILLLILSYFLFFAPKIVMPNFIGQKKEDVAAWVRQEGITASGIVMKDEYNFENADGVIMDQSVDEGSKVGKDVKITFVVSKGADPDEKIAVPDIASMNKTEIEEWIVSNKLSKTKMTTTYSDTVPANEVISFEIKGVDKEDFTRSSVCNISISKGPQPAGSIKVEDFKGKDVMAVENWAKTNKINLVKEETFSDTVAVGSVISQSVEAGKTMSAKETLTIYVSKGKGVKVPDFSSMSKTDVNKWCAEHGVTPEMRYSKKSGYVISQKPAAGGMIGGDEKVELVLNNGPTFYAADEGVELIGSSFSKLVDKCNELRAKGIDAYADSWTTTETYSKTYSQGQIISATCSGYSDKKTYACNGPLPIDARFDVTVSKGKYYDLADAVGEGANLNTITGLADYLSAKVSFKIAENISSDDYGTAPKLLCVSDGNTQVDLNSGTIFEDKEYRIEKQ